MHQVLVPANEPLLGFFMQIKCSTIQCKQKGDFHGFIRNQAKFPWICTRTVFTLCMHNVFHAGYDPI